MISSPLTLLRSAFEIYREKFSTIFPLGIIVFMIGIFQLLGIEIHSDLLFMLSVLSGIVVSYIVYIAMIKAISSSDQIPIGKLFEEIQPHIAPAIWVSAMMVLVVSGSFLFFILPGIMAVIFLLFSMMSVIIDGKRKHEALLYSWSLVRGRWWQVFWRFFAANIVIGLAATLIMFVLWLLGLGESPLRIFFTLEKNTRAFSFSQSVASQIVSNLFVVPLSVAFTFVLYEELKKLPQQIVSEKEKRFTMSYIRFFAGAGAAFIIAGIFAFGFFVARFLPNVVNVTHAPAAVFEAL